MVVLELPGIRPLALWIGVWIVPLVVFLCLVVKFLQHCFLTTKEGDVALHQVFLANESTLHLTVFLSQLSADLHQTFGGEFL